MIEFFVFLYGLVFGSFYCVIIFRLTNNENPLRGRSKCNSCGKILKPINLIPVFSWIFQKGKCSYCGGKISSKYIIIEIITGILFLLAYKKFGFTLSFVNAIIFWSMLLIVSVIDYLTLYIYDSVLFIFGILSFIVIFMYQRFEIIDNFISMAIGFFIYFLIYFVSKKIYKKEAFGFGDVLLISIVTFNIELKLIFFSLFLPFYIAFIYVIIKFMFKKLIKNEVFAFGPFICLSAFILSIFGEYIGDLFFI